MLITVYHHRHWDQIKVSSIIIPKISTEERIKRSGGEIINETTRQIDDSLLDAEGNALIQLNDENWKILQNLASCNG